MKRKTTLALYGNIAIKCGYCNTCEGMAFVLDGALACCGAEFAENAERYERIFQPEPRRRQPKPTHKKRILDEQGFRCLYCERSFGAVVERNGKSVKLKINWDHQVPYSLSQNNMNDNFVAACQICNNMKHNHVLQTLDEARVSLTNRWAEKGYCEAVSESE